jgi:TonB family protein
MIQRAARRFAWVAVILLTLSAHPVPQETLKAESVRMFWYNGVRSLEDRNIEKYAVNEVHPAYPPLAEKYRIEGQVTVNVQVDPNGKVTKAEFLKGHSIFRAVSLDAAKQWQFKPPDHTALEGTINFSFKLRG